MHEVTGNFLKDTALTITDEPVDRETCTPKQIYLQMLDRFMEDAQDDLQLVEPDDKELLDFYSVKLKTGDILKKHLDVCPIEMIELLPDRNDAVYDTTVCTLEILDQLYRIVFKDGAKRVSMPENAPRIEG